MHSLSGRISSAAHEYFHHHTFSLMGNKNLLKFQNSYFRLPASNYIHLNFKWEASSFFIQTKGKPLCRFSAVWAVTLGCLTAIFLPWNQKFPLETRLPYANFNRLWPLQLTSDADNCCAGFSYGWQLCRYK